MLHTYNLSLYARHAITSQFLKGAGTHQMLEWYKLCRWSRNLWLIPGVKMSRDRHKCRAVGAKRGHACTAVNLFVLLARIIRFLALEQAAFAILVHWWTMKRNPCKATDTMVYFG